MTDALVRSVEFTLSRDAAEGDGKTLEGYAAVFNSPTRIQSWEGTFDEQIAPGAFKKSIRENTPVLQFDHGRHPMVGSLPLGSIEKLREDGQGLFVRAALHDNWLVEPVRDAIASGAVDGMSFRFQVVKDEWRDAKGAVVTDPATIQRAIWQPDPKNILQRTLKEVRVMELGPVVFPAYKGTSVGVRSEQLAELLGDPDARAELARALLAPGTSEAPSEGEEPSGVEEAARTEEPGDHSEETSVGDAERRAAANARHRRALQRGIHS